MSQNSSVMSDLTACSTSWLTAVRAESIIAINDREREAAQEVVGQLKEVDAQPETGDHEHRG